jgi:hypothetical protein
MERLPIHPDFEQRAAIRCFSLAIFAALIDVVWLRRHCSIHSFRVTRIAPRNLSVRVAKGRNALIIS